MMIMFRYPVSSRLLWQLIQPVHPKNFYPKTKFSMRKSLAEVHKSIRFNLAQKRKINYLFILCLGKFIFPLFEQLVTLKDNNKMKHSTFFHFDSTFSNTLVSDCSTSMKTNNEHQPNKPQ